MKKFILSIIFFYIYFLSLAICYADIPRTINYQGKLTDKQGYALNGTYNITLRLYDAQTAGNLLWQEAHTDVSVSKGLFSVLLGTITPLNLPFDKQYYLSIQVGADPEMTPRQQLASAPYAFRSQDNEGTIASIFKKFGGDGSDGAKTVGGDESWDSRRRQYSTLVIEAGKTVTASDKIVIIGVSGDCTINGTIMADGQGAIGGTGLDITKGNPGQRGDFVPATPLKADAEVANAPVAFSVGGAGGGGGSTSGAGYGGLGGGAGGTGGNSQASGNPTPDWKIRSLMGSDSIIAIMTAINSFGAGGGGGGGPNGAEGTGGRGGGVIYLEVNGALNFTGSITAKGNNGIAASSNNAGGGGGGGCIYIRAKKVGINNGTLNASGGDGGPAANAARGASGYVAIVTIK